MKWPHDLYDEFNEYRAGYYSALPEWKKWWYHLHSAENGRRLQVEFLLGKLAEK